MAETAVLIDPAILGDEDEVELTTWLAPDGSGVLAGQPIAEVTAAKATVEILAPVAGQLRHLVAAGTVVEAGHAIASIVG
jgi:pyruvate/2-oxoglutarate dehydrogenase complex dihydrolipoamide acyltransferase (E2) component